MSELRRRVMGGGEAPVPDIEPVNGDNLVDLGLSSGLYWAKCNVGASSETASGDFYQWGAGTTKYSSSYNQYDSSLVMPADKDTATQVLGAGWRTPTQTEYEEMINNTSFEWTYINSVLGCKFTAQNGNYIFFPACGAYPPNHSSKDWVNEFSLCWYGDASNATESFFFLGSSSGGGRSGSTKNSGLTVRGVMEGSKVTFRCSTTDGTTKEGVELTVKGSNIEYTISTNAQGLVALILPDGNYTISSETHTLDVSQFVVTGSMVIDIQAAKIPIDYAYVTIDQTKSDPSQMITVKDENGTVQTLVNGVHQNTALQRLRSSSHLYMGYNVDGTERLFQLKDDDGTTFIDGTTADMTGGDGDHWMRIGEPFYIKRTEGVDSGDVVTYGLAVGGKPDSTWKQLITPNDLIGVKEAIAEDTGDNATGKLYSKSGAASTASISQANFKTKARNGGEGFTLVTWEWHNIMAFLFWGWYGNTNSQGICGRGSDSYWRYTGGKDSYGMRDTDSTNGNTDSSKFWGLEDWWSYRYEAVDNMSISNYVWTVTDVKSGSTRSAGTGGSSSGFIKKLLLSENLDLIPTAVGGDGSTYYCDYYSQSTGTYIFNRARSAGAGYGGITFAHAQYSSTVKGESRGTRLAYHGDIEIVQSYTDYKYRGVDLGLPSGKIWSEVNIGASSAEQAGLYFSWGNTQGYAAGSGHDFSQSTYDAKTDGNGVDLTGDIPVSAEYDAAVKYCGGKWRMPTKDEWVELSDNCNATYTSRNGVNGWLLTSKTNGETLFVPNCGYFTSSSISSSAFLQWTATMKDSSRGISVYGNSSSILTGDNPDPKYYGCTIRPIRLPHAVTLRLKDGSDNALSGVGITISDSYGFVASVTTDSNGEGVFYCESGTYTLSCKTHTLSVNSVVVTGDAIVNVVGVEIPLYVDLGLPSGLLWAQGNICKSSNGNYYIGEETDYGCYFSWGNTVGYNSDEGYPFDNSSYNSTPGASLTTDISAINDAATVNLGTSWRMPTNDETVEMVNNTDRQWATINGITGFKFMKKSDHSVYIFMPTAGSIRNGSPYNVASSGYYWLSTIWQSNTRYGCNVNFSGGGLTIPSNGYRYYGFTIRPVISRNS